MYYVAGLTGVGKSWLASALGHKACRDNRSVLYHRVPKLFEDLALAALRELRGLINQSISKCTVRRHT